jgi:O-antigen/teichoic acid export membrane protein
MDVLSAVIATVRTIALEAVKTIISPRRLKRHLGISLYRNAIYLMVNSVAQAATGSFFWVLAARLYTPEDVGFASAIMAAAGLLVMLSTLGLTYGLIRFLATSDSRHDLINSCLTVGGLVALGLSIIFLAGLDVWSPALIIIRQNAWLSIAFIIFTAALTLKTFSEQAFVARRRAGFTLAQGLVFGLLRFVPLVLLATVLPTPGIFLSWGIAILVATTVGLYFFLPKAESGYRPRLVIKGQAINDILRFSFANYAANLLWALPQYLLPLVVVNLLGAEANAYFYIGWSVAGILFIIPLATSLSLFAEGAHDEGSLLSNAYQGLGFTLLLLAVGIPIVFFFDDKILLIFGVSYSESASRLVRLLALSSLPLALNSLYFHIRWVQKKMRGVIILSGLLTAGTLLLGYLLMPRMGIDGAAVAWLGSQTAIMVIVGAMVIKSRLGTG